jgi:hypothetical protein
MPQDYITKTLDLYNMVKAKAVGTTGTTSFSHRLDLDDPPSTDEHKVYRTAVGKLLWLALIRPDMSYATKGTFKRPDCTDKPKFTETETFTEVPRWN